ncbi:OpgC protein [Shimia sp. SK013]|uniref:OpgC domain-containing protein n=1 Tax=Shimia sp. SK013 TaxID=1389006 RepID=UPI0006B643FE|nr:OpgC domain-containing protein [Shimia sp. SK013]KPA22089.1 OpgC protein [Shimia sp. SK013]
MRFDLLDGVRGHLLFMMMLAHLAAQPGMGYLYDVHHARIIQLLDAEFLVFLSGLLVGILYALKFQSRQKLADFLGLRIRKIYVYYILSAGPFLILLLMGGAGPVQYLFGLGEVAVLQNGGAYSDILPIYIVCFALLWVGSFLLRWVPQWALLVPSGALYAASLFDYGGGIFGWGQRYLVFDLVAWQFLFCIAYLCGVKFREILAWINGLSVRGYWAVFVLTAVACFGQRWVFFYPPIAELPTGVAVNWPRMHLHPVHIVRTMAVVAFVTVAMTRSERGTGWITDVLRWYFSLPLLRYCGVWAIQMFVIHVFLIAAFAYVLPTLSAGEAFIAAMIAQGLFMIIPWGLHRAKKGTLLSGQASA